MFISEFRGYIGIFTYLSAVISRFSCAFTGMSVLYISFRIDRCWLVADFSSYSFIFFLPFLIYFFPILFFLQLHWFLVYCWPFNLDYSWNCVCVCLRKCVFMCVPMCVRMHAYADTSTCAHTHPRVHRSLIFFSFCNFDDFINWKYQKELQIPWWVAEEKEASLVINNTNSRAFAETWSRCSRLTEEYGVGTTKVCDLKKQKRQVT